MSDATTMTDSRLEFARLVRTAILQQGLLKALELVQMLLDGKADKAAEFVSHQAKYLAFALVVNHGDVEARRMLKTHAKVSGNELEYLLHVGRKSAAVHQAKEQKLGRKIEVVIAA